MSAKQRKTCTCSKESDEQELLACLDDIIAEYKSKPGALIPILQHAQTLFGYLPDDVLRKIARELNKSLSEVTGVVSFYSFFSTVPRGKYLIRVCLGTACYVRGGKEVLEAFKHKLGIDVGQTTEDRMFSLDIGRCFGACGLAPVIMVNDDVHQRVKSSKIGEIIDLYKSAENNGNGAHS
ncbi:MAG: NAD(P)H-dependent oxidoreductase subunit E [Spirochaetaceae bacterium]|nr:MAG: NAD(P)H-dependent oxidoreductase subunit E [Spirochaetaceae bacterium]